VVVENGQISGVMLSVNMDYYREPAFIEQIVLNFYPMRLLRWKRTARALCRALG
jgi:hypothetical protein